MSRPDVVMLDTTVVSDTDDQHAQLSNTERLVGGITDVGFLDVLKSAPPSRRGSNASQLPGMEDASVYRTLELNIPHLRWSPGGKQPSDQGEAENYYVRRCISDVDDENENENAPDAPASSAIGALLEVPSSNPHSRRASVSSADSSASHHSSQSSNHSGSSGSRPHSSSRIGKRQKTGKSKERSVSARRAASVQHAASRGNCINVSFDPCLTWDQSRCETTCSNYVINIKVETNDLDADKLGDHFAAVTERVFDNLIKTESAAAPVLPEREVEQALKSAGNVFTHLGNVPAHPHPNVEQVAEDFVVNRRAAEDAFWDVHMKTNETERKFVEALRKDLNSTSEYDKVSVNYALPTYTVSTPGWPREFDNPTFKFGPSATPRQLRKDQIKDILKRSLNQPRGEGDLATDIVHISGGQLDQQFGELSIEPRDDIK